MAIGIRLHDAGGATLTEKAQTARDIGFGCVHLALSKVMDPSYTQPAVLTPGLAAHVRTALAPLNTAILGCYQNLAHPDKYQLQQIQASYVAHLRFAKWLGASVVGTETGNPNPEYRFEPDRSHSQQALDSFVEGLLPVVAAAEKLGAILALEPVFTHIVSSSKKLRWVLDQVASPNLQVILDPVNLLHGSNLNRKEHLLREAVDLLMDDIAVVHAKDYVQDQGQIIELAPGQGIMNYKPLFSDLKKHKPYLDITLECTEPDNAKAAFEHIRNAWEEA